MSETDQRNSRIRDRIAASQARLERDAAELPTLPRRELVAAPGLLGTTKDHPLLTVAAGVGLGLLAGALLPRKAGGKFGRRVMGAAAAAAELGFALCKQARDKAGEGARDGLALLDDSTAPLRQRANRSARSARSQGVRLAGEAIKLAARLRK